MLACLFIKASANKENIINETPDRFPNVSLSETVVEQTYSVSEKQETFMIFSDILVSQQLSSTLLCWFCRLLLIFLSCSASTYNEHHH